MTRAFPDPRQVLSRHGLRAKKSWGQSFLVDPRIHDAICRQVVRAPDDWVVEIGAGLGTLTLRLAAAATAGRVVAVERDRDMVAILREELAGLDNVEIAEENAMTFDYGRVANAAGRRLAVAGNLPYQIASPLLFGMRDARRHIARAVVMLQKEMADRLIAPPGSRTYGVLSVLMQAWAHVRPVARARAGAFHPPPRVDSQVVLLETRDALPAEVAGEPVFADVVHAAFGQRRKTLRNALAARFGTEPAEAALARAGLDGKRRAETLSVDELCALADAVRHAGAA